MTEPLQDFAKSHYDRPNQKWICGHAELEGGCPKGPGAGGVCLTHALCEPIQEAGKWKCARSRLQGGKCDAGPDESGACGCQIQSCLPRRSLRSQRGRFVFACFAAAAAILAIKLSSADRHEFLAPGPLAESHAVILKDANSGRCANCHAAGNQGSGKWLFATVAGQSASATPQWTLCLECHKNLIAPEHALLPHSIAADELNAITQVAFQRTVSENDENLALKFTGENDHRACAACHQEHHGALYDLTAMSDQQCSGCHQSQFASFAEGHPEFSNWPHRRRSRIVFDHVSHGQRYFRTAKRDFQCSGCHAIDANNEPQLIGGFEQNCASCHYDDLKASMDDQLALIKLPIVDPKHFAREGLSIGEWPEDLSGDFDGPLTPLMYLMLWADPLAKPCLEQFGSGFDFFDIDPNNYDELEAASELVWAIKRLLLELKRDGQMAIVRRASLVNETGTVALEQEDIAALTVGFEAAAVQRLVKPFSRLDGEVQNLPTPGGEGFEKKLLKEVAASPAEWVCSEDQSELCIRVKGHANPLLRAWIDLAAQLGAGVAKNAQALTSTTGVGRCTMCHSVEFASEQQSSLMVNWHADPNHASAAPSVVAHGMSEHGFTKFRHNPHLSQRNLSDCVSCHEVQLQSEYAAGYESLDPRDGCSGFESLSKADCVSCHVKDGAGDACLKCHNYHAASR